jgi:hypothetical protein
MHCWSGEWRCVVMYVCGSTICCLCEAALVAHGTLEREPYFKALHALLER